MASRVHNRKISLSKSKTGLRKIASRAKKRLDTKLATVPEGGYVLLVRCLHEDRNGSIRVVDEVEGTPGMLEAMRGFKTSILDAHNRAPRSASTDADDGDEDETLQEFLVMPGNAEDRAAKVRKMLRLLWARHVEGTPFRKHKQPFKAVKDKGAPPFPWWDEVTDGAPFHYDTVKIPEMSRKLFEHMVPLLRARPEADEEESPSPSPVALAVTEQCLRSPWCINQRGHRGRCKLVGVPMLVDESVPIPPAEPMPPLASGSKKKKKKKKKRKRDDGDDEDRRRKTPPPLTEEAKAKKMRSKERHHKAALAQVERQLKAGIEMETNVPVLML